MSDAENAQTAEPEAPERPPFPDVKRGDVIEEVETRRKYGKGNEPEDREKRLPTDENLSIRQINATEDVRKMEMESLTGLIGVEPYNDWEIRVWRIGPDEFRGRGVESRRIERMRVGIPWKDLETKMERVHGGGVYRVFVHDAKGTSRKSKQIEVQGAPKWNVDVYPEFAGAGAGTGETEDELELKSRIRKTKLKQELEELTGGGKGDDGASAVQFISNVMIRQIEATERRLDDMARQNELREQRTQERFERMMDKVVEKMEEVGASDDDGESEKLTLFQIMQESNKAMITAITEGFKSQMTSMQTQMQADKENSLNMMKLMTEINRPPKDNTLDILNMINSTQMHKMDMSVELLKALLPIVAGQEDNKDPKVQLAETIIQGIEKTYNVLQSGIQLHKLRGTQLTQGQPQHLHIGRQGQPGQPQPGPAPQTPPQGQPQPGPAPQQGQAPPGMQDFDPNASIIDTYRSIDDVKKVNFVITSMVEEAKQLPNPEVAVFPNLVLLEETPEMLVNFIMDVEDAKDMRQKFTAWMQESDIAELDKQIFSIPEKVEWLNRCLDYIKASFTYVDDEGNEVETVDAQATVEQTDETPEEEDGVESPGEPLGEVKPDEEQVNEEDEQGAEGQEEVESQEADEQKEDENAGEEVAEPEKQEEKPAKPKAKKPSAKGKSKKSPDSK